MDLGGFTIQQWTEKRDIIKSQTYYSEDWDEAIDWYKARLKVRYFDPMKRIEKNAQGEGFSLVTIHCALIEHLASITEGKIYNHRRSNNPPNYEYGFSSQHFRQFLEESDIFSQYFTASNGKKALFNSVDFYANIRCALLHDACIKNNWRINTLSCQHHNPNKEVMTIDELGIKRLYRDILTDKLSDFLESYKIELESNQIKRLYFARKMDHLCEIAPDDNYPWWKDI